MVKLFNQDEATFSGNGICVLDPSVCEVSETAGGAYELYLEHPIDAHGKYAMLAENMIIEAPVPYTEIPKITMPETEILQVNASTDFWKKLPVYKKKSASAQRIASIRNNPVPYYWGEWKAYIAGSYCVYPATSSGSIWQAKSYSYHNEPKQGSLFWSYVAKLDGTGDTPTYTPGVAYSPALSVGASVTKLADYSAEFYQIKDAQGRIGYIDKTKVTVQTTEAEEIPKQTIRTQLFRIYKVESSEDNDLILVSAKHISYDFAGNRIMDCKIMDTEPVNALALMQGNLMYEDSRQIACQFKSSGSKSYKISKDWSFKNPVNALLDPDDGIVNALKARLIRNNKDFYILKNNNPRTGITIEYGINMLGVTWSRDTEPVATRVVPRCSDGNDGYLFLEHGGTWSDETMETWVQNNDIYVDSPIADQYPYPKIEVLDCDFSVGEKYTPTGSSTEITMKESDCRAEMLKKAQKRFTEDRCDGLDITLTVEFLLIGDSEQYRQYRGLQRVNLYDKVTIRSRLTEATAQVTKYAYNCLTGRYNSVTVGTVLSFQKRVPGYRIVKEAISYEKLSPDIINRIRTLNGAVGSVDGGSGSGAGTGENLTPAIDLNSASNDGLVKKGSGEGSKYWATDASGNPDWRSLPAVTVPLNSKTDDGLVAKGSGHLIQCWETDEQGNPAWRNIHIQYVFTASQLPVTGELYTIYIVLDTQEGYYYRQGNWYMLLAPDTWRPVQDNLTTDSGTDCLSARQGKILNEKIGKYYTNSKYGSNTAGSLTVNVPAGTYLVLAYGKTQSSATHISMYIDNAQSASFDYFSTITPTNGSAQVLGYMFYTIKTYNSASTITLNYSANWYSLEMTAFLLQ